MSKINFKNYKKFLTVYGMYMCREAHAIDGKHRKLCLY